MVLACILTIISAYLLGSINTSIILSKAKKNDIRSHGSGNAGATNVLRVMGKAAAALVIVGDAAKAFVAVGVATLIGKWLGVVMPQLLVLKYLAVTFVVIGHDFPLYFGFKGGKGIVTSVAIIFALDWRLGIMVLGTGVFCIVLTRFVSLGSMVGCVIFPLFCISMHMNAPWSYESAIILPALLLGALGLWRHRGNIKKLMSGTENKIGDKSKK